MSDLADFIKSELSELESRDIDTLYECIIENLRDMGYPHDPDDVYEEIQAQLQGNSRYCTDCEQWERK
ncbi:MAG: hypothetical protein HC836_45155 [Richelia sp. RM2_1_2]|nr:hypothetical protein [Richelia sp. RM2_1_2]